jgi:Rieske Fe-S protein
MNLDEQFSNAEQGPVTGGDADACQGVTRREALIMAAGVGALALLPIFKASADTPEQWVNVGKVGEFAIGTPNRLALTPPGATVPPPGMAPVKEVLWVTRVNAKSLVAVSAKCTHHGCEVAWQPDDKDLECPCHHAVFDVSGKNLRGAQRDPGSPLNPLLSLPVREKGGVVEVNLAGIAPDLLEPRERR